MSKRKKENIRDKNAPSMTSLQFGALWKQREYALPLIAILLLTAMLYLRALQNGILSWDESIAEQ